MEDLRDDPHLYQLFPHFRAAYVLLKSSADIYYNCIAWAPGDTLRSRWPVAGQYWPRPRRAPTEIETFLEVFADLQYEECAGSDVEPGFEKLAIYFDFVGEPKPMARQIGPAWPQPILNRSAKPARRLRAALGKICKMVRGGREASPVTIFIREMVQSARFRMPMLHR